LRPRRTTRAAGRTREAEDRRQLRARHPIPNWQGFLEAEAGRGNEAALSALRARQQRRDRVEAAFVGSRPAVRRNGRVVYGVADGGLVCDQQVRVNQVTAGAAFLALTLAADRFGNRPLNVQGTDDFRKQVAELSGIEGLGVSFADAGLERQRQRATVARANRIDREAGVFIRSNVSDDRDRSR
jgi:hypothetical protein